MASGSPGEHDAHLHLCRALSVQALLGGDGPATDVFEFTVAGISQANSLDLPPRPTQCARRFAPRPSVLRHSAKAQLDELIATGYVMPHWPRPGRAAGAVEQLLVEESSRKPESKRPDYGITGCGY